MKRYIEIILKIVEDKNLVPKLGSIILAVILWAYISSAKSGDVKFKLPVTITGIEDNYVVSKLSQKVIVVEVMGNKDDLKNISSKNIKLLVDVSNSEPGEYQTYKIQYQKIDFTDDFNVELSPEEIKVLIEKKVSRNVKIIPKSDGFTAKGFMVGKIRVSPEYVKISGPESVVNSMGAVYTEEISVEDKNAPFRQDIKIAKVNEEVVEFNISKVNAVVTILNYSEIVTFEIPVAIINKKKGYRYFFNSDKVKINLIVPENKNITERSFTAFIDAGEIEIDNDEFIKKSRIEVMGLISVNGDSSEADNAILSSTPDSVEIVVTKE